MVSVVVRKNSWFGRHPDVQVNIASMLKISGVVLFGALLLVGCVATRPVENPIPLTSYDTDNARADVLILFLPGRGDDMDAFERSGFIDILHQSSWAVDSIVIDAHIGYYRDGSLPDRVYREILIPFHQQGYKHFIIVGVSLGGYGALWINHEHGVWISGMVLIAPYLGHESLITQIDAEGSVHSWRLQLDHAPGLDEKVWIWIDDIGGPDSEKNQPLILACGLKDDYRSATELLAESYPGSHLFKYNGGHNWKTWRSLWSEIIKSYAWENLGYTR
jgi:hypothetical protein